MAAALSFTDVSKHYRGAYEYRALRDDIMASLGRVVGRKRPDRHVVKALDEISLEIPEGQSFAIVGPNGAGKTTALKLATRITYPTSGRVRVRGRVGALIEVGTGMHPELTGRENVNLYGRILGLTGRDIARRFDEIVDFAEIGSAIDQPVKQYSSGMQLRLGFSVAAHLEPDVFLVDEAIAVGDEGFQYRCTERMAALVREGRTLVFVSHNLSAVETLCTRGILLRSGKVAAEGSARDVVRQYYDSVHGDRLVNEQLNGAATGDGLQITAVTFHSPSGEKVDDVVAGKPMVVRLHYRTNRPIRRPLFSVGLSDGRSGCIFIASMLVDGKAPTMIDGTGYVDCVFEDLPLLPKTYEVWGSVRGETGFGDLVDWQRLRLIRVRGEISGNGVSTVSSIEWAPVKVPYHWNVSAGAGHE
jgi:ABC-type polysaccharide/polyol phosphate transport system ATPase subunit